MEPAILINMLGFVSNWFIQWRDRRNEEEAEEERRRRLRRVVIRRLIRRRRIRAQHNRTLWSHIHHSSHWEATVPLWDDIRFQKKFRIGRITFDHLCNLLRPHLEKQDTVMRRAIPVDKRVAIALTMLKSNADLWSVGDVYGVGKSTIGHILHEFCDACCQLYNESVVFPKSPAERKSVGDGFLERWQFPDCLGALDGTHIPILTPKDCPTDYYNYKGYHSIIVLALVDYNYKFLYTNVGRPGRMNDSSVFANSGLFTYMDNWAAANTEEPDFHIIGDGAFPVLKWLLTPYRQTLNMPHIQYNYNYRLSRARVVVENAFGRLKGRWRILLKRADFELENMKKIVKACIFLHNLCEENSEPFYPHWNNFVDEFQIGYPQPHGDNRAVNNNLTGVAKRNNMANQLYNDRIPIL